MTFYSFVYACGTTFFACKNMVQTEMFVVCTHCTSSVLCPDVVLFEGMNLVSRITSVVHPRP